MTEQASRPDPMVPADVDLHGMEFMPLHVQRVMQSMLFAKSTGDEFKAAFALWCASWYEVPAASLPNDEEALEFLSKSKKWKQVRARALHGWVLCSDGRLYHKTVAISATQAWNSRVEYQEKSGNKNGRQQRWREKVKELSEVLRARGVVPPMNPTKAELEHLVALHVDGEASTKPSTEASTVVVYSPSTGDKSETAKRGTGEETEIKRSPKSPKRGRAPRTAVGLVAWLEECKAKGEKPVPEDDAVFAYAAQVGIPRDFLRLAWLEFRHQHTLPNAKCQKDWRAHFRNAVRRNWGKLWYLSGDSYQLTTVGLQAQRAHQEKAAA